MAGCEHPVSIEFCLITYHIYVGRVHLCGCVRKCEYWWGVPSWATPGNLEGQVLPGVY